MSALIMDVENNFFDHVLELQPVAKQGKIYVIEYKIHFLSAFCLSDQWLRCIMEPNQWHKKEVLS